MSGRHFDHATRRVPTRKPTELGAVATVELHGEDLSSIPTYSISYAGLGPLDALAANLEGLEVEFAAFAPGGRTFLVNTEGYRYARYLGELPPPDAFVLLDRRGGWEGIRRADEKLVRRGGPPEV